MSNDLLRLQDLFRSLAQQLREALAVESDLAGWTDAFVDVRYTRDGSRWARNTQVTVMGKPVSVGAASGEINDLIKEIWQNQFGTTVYGFVLSINHCGEVNVRLNYDADCFADPGFWAS